MKTPYKIFGGVVFAVTQAVSQSPSQTASPATLGAAPHTVQATELPAAHPIATVDPKYPKEAKKQKRQGQVVLRVRIGADGTVKDLSVISGDADFAAAATQGVKKWRFQPYLVDGKPTQAEQSVTVNFTLPSDAPPRDSSQRLSDDDFNKAVDARVAGGSLLRSVLGPGVTPPKAIRMTDPAYSQEAKDARVEGTVLLQMILEADGAPGEIYVSRSLGHGLDEKAIEAVRSWKFNPATKDGQPAAVVMNVEVKFHLY